MGCRTGFMKQHVLGLINLSRDHAVHPAHLGVGQPGKQQRFAQYALILAARTLAHIGDALAANRQLLADGSRAER